MSFLRGKKKSDFISSRGEVRGDLFINVMHVLLFVCLA